MNSARSPINPTWTLKNKMQWRQNKNWKLWNKHNSPKKIEEKTQNSTKHKTTQGTQMGLMFERHTHENETHTHGRTMGHENTAMEKKKIEWKTNQNEAYTWSNRLLIPLDVIPCWGSHFVPLSSFKNSMVWSSMASTPCKGYVITNGFETHVRKKLKNGRKGMICASEKAPKEGSS